MGLYRAKWNVKDSAGQDVAIGGLANLNEADAVQLAGLGAIEPEAIVGPDVLSPDQRMTVLSGFIPNLTLGDLSPAGLLSAEGEQRIEKAIGFVPTADELRAASEAFIAGAWARTTNVLGSIVKLPAPGGIQSSDPMVRLHGEAAAASPTTEANVRAESSGLTAEQRQAAIFAAVAALLPADYRGDGSLRAETRRRLHTELGYEVGDDELRAAIEAAKAAPPAA